MIGVIQMKKETISGKFQEDYRDLFERLDREAKTKDERWQLFIKNKRVYEEFYADILKAGDYLKDWDYLWRPEKQDIENMTRNKEPYHKNFDGDVFQKAMKKAIESYELGNTASFLTFFTTIYKREGIDDKKKEKGITNTMMLLITAVQKIQGEETISTAEDIIYAFGDMFEKENICKIFKADGTLAEVPQKVIAYLDKGELPLDNEKYGEVISDAPLIIDKIMNDYDEKNMVKNYRNAVRDYLENQITAMKSDPRRWEFYRAFWTRDIMKLLKLEDGEPYTETPAGNPDEYAIMEKMLEPVWYRIFYKPYIEAIIQDKPEDLQYLYGQYYNLLKREDIESRQLLSKIMHQSVQRLLLQEEKNKENYNTWRNRLLSELSEIVNP